MKSFDEVGNEVGTDKVSCGYGPLYDGLVFTKIDRRQPCRILELGVHNGASMRLWEQLFPQAQIIGLDIEPRCLQYATERASIVIGNQTDAALLRSLGEFDLVVDDCSHDGGDIVASFEALWPQTKMAYVVEDAWVDHVPSILAAIEAAGGRWVCAVSAFPNRRIIFVFRGESK